MPGMLQPAGDLRFQHEARPALRVIGMPVLDFLQRHLAVQLLIERHGDLAQPALGVRPQDAETQAAGGRLAHRRRRVGPVRVLISLARRGDVNQARLHVGVGDALQVILGGAQRTDRGQALLRIVTVLLEVFLDQRLQQGVVRRRRGRLVAQYLAERLALLEHPGIHGRDQGIAADEVHLQR